MKHFFPLVLLSVCLLFSACKKDKDETDPVITIYSPYQNQYYNAGDTAHLVVKVSDETKLTSVKVALQDLNGTNVMNSVNVNVQANSFQFSLDYILYDLHIASGDYKIVVMASDGNNDESAGIVIYINSPPLAKRYFFFANENASTTNITRLDSVFGNPQPLTFAGKFVALESSSWYQRLFVAGEVSAPFNTYKANNHQLAWSVADFGAGNPYFSSLSSDGKNVCAGYWDGRILQYDNSGNIAVNYQTGTTTYYPVFTYVEGNYLFAGLKDFMSSANEFKRFDRYTGVQQTQYGVNWLPVAMGNKTTGETYVVGNTNAGQAVLNVYYTASNSFYSPMNLPTGAALAGAVVDSDYLIIAHSNGNIYRYQYSSNSLLSIYNGLTASKISYNAELNELYVSSGSNFYIFNVAPFSLSLKTSYTHGVNIDDFEVVFNK